MHAPIEQSWTEIRTYVQGIPFELLEETPMNRFCAWAVVAALASPSISTANSDPMSLTGSGFADRLYRLDCGHSLANDESVWTPGENVGRSIEFSSTCWLIKHGDDWLQWDTGVPETAHSDPKGWSTLPKLIVYHLD